MANKLKDKVVVITGASSGIGEAMARVYADMGAKVVLGARQGDKLDALCKDIISRGGKAAWAVTDVTKAEDCKQLIDTAVENFGGIDVMICNAGISMRALFDDLDLSVLHRLMDVNFWGTVYCTKYALPYLLEAKEAIDEADITMAHIRKQNQTMITDTNGKPISSLHLVNSLPNGKIQTVNSMKYHSKTIKERFNIDFKFFNNYLI